MSKASLVDLGKSIRPLAGVLVPLLAAEVVEPSALVASVAGICYQRGVHLQPLCQPV